MARIEIKDLPTDMRITHEEMHEVMGGMKGDFSDFQWLIFRPITPYTGVKLQQGSVLVDDDWNE